MKVEFYRHCLGEPEKQKVLECLDGIFLTTGQYVKDFEKQFAAYLNTKHAIGLTSCTAALHLSLLALKIGPGDEVITTPMTFIATPNAVLYVGATPVFVDVEPATGLIDPARIEAAITAHTRAIIAVHLYGQMCDMKKIHQIAQKYNLKVIEDCAHCVEGERDGIKPGQLSDTACFSFYATKNLTCGEGGAVTTNDDQLAASMITLRQHGVSKSAADRYTGVYQHWDMIELGWKYNMSNIQAALLLPQIQGIESRWQKRDELYKEYYQALKDIPLLRFPKIVEGSKSAYHLFTVLVKGQNRDLLLKKLNEAGIGCAVNYRAVHLLSFYHEKFGFTAGSFPHAEKIGDETLTLPFWVGLSTASIAYIKETIRTFCRNHL